MTLLRAEPPCAANPHLFDLDSPDPARAARVCASCPDRASCAALGVARAESGVWGGLLLDQGRPARPRPTCCAECRGPLPVSETGRRRVICSRRCALRRQARRAYQRAVA